MLHKGLLIILVGILLISFTACAATEEEVEVVAIVNSQEIRRVDFESVVENTKLYYQQQFGIDFQSEDDKGLIALIEEDALNNLIEQELLLQSTLERDYQVSKDELNYEIEQIKSQFESEEEFSMALEVNQLTLALLEEDIANEIMLRQYIQDEVGDPTVSEEEMMAMYDEYSETMEDLPSFEEIQPQLQEEIKYQKFQASLWELLETLKAEGNIEILL
ncbi:conserved hypothetical protein [Alkaliphilus metalliredigens QYMF]|uniref:SurA domain n=1 Tax=Alkaliphilus metalliredigens (strain QYMF) TaxID=293826 RepID=A6TQ69_ALKMQ|nr:SurA N-terminal domain-containing protein [Alkaliphilus metalliredigens]ABR48337.1 conserved hypothetical protein [Alkaliphilus metalliredigens QYMF]